MKIAVTYIYPNAGAGGYFELAMRFMQTYHEHPPGLDHDTVIVCNGKPGTDETRFYFGSLPNLTLLDHDGSGYDIGGFQAAARNYPCDLMLFFGSTAYFRHANWMKRVVESFNTHGDTIYGAMGNQGAQHAHVKPHIRTTGFWLSPSLMNSYPILVTRPEQRYEYEHGVSGLTSWLISQGKQPWVVSVYSGDYVLQACDSIPEGYHNGNQTNLLFGDRLTCSPYYGVP